MLEKLSNCRLCPHKCGVNRLEGKKGICHCDDKLKIALASLHFYEEPCISGVNGSGTVFFTNCNLQCKYCQNYEISQLQKGIRATTRRTTMCWICPLTGWRGWNIWT